MDLKFYLNKFCKVDNIEGYTYRTLLTLKKAYDEFLEKSDGFDPDYPGMSFGNKGTKISTGRNIYSQFKDESEIPNDFSGLHGDLLGMERKPEISQLPSTRQQTRKDRDRSNEIYKQKQKDK